MICYRFGNIAQIVNPDCFPQDDRQQIFEVINSYFTLPSNPSMNWLSSVYTLMQIGTTREYITKYENLTFEHIHYSFYFVLLNLGMPDQKVYVKSKLFFKIYQKLSF